MRLKNRIALAAILGSVLAAPLSGQRPDDQIAARSIELQRQGEALLGAGKFIEAADTLETALAVDPRNRSAFVALAKVAQKQKLFGKSIRLTNKALALEPADRDALAVQGEAMVELGALPRARENLVKLQKLCAGGCPQVASLSTAISRGPTVAAARTPATPKTN
jgi:Tfp pilus assembly protein PilF